MALNFAYAASRRARALEWTYTVLVFAASTAVVAVAGSSDSLHLGLRPVVAIPTVASEAVIGDHMMSVASASFEALAGGYRAREDALASDWGARSAACSHVVDAQVGTAWFG